jgi:5'-deoxynucleotidase
MSHFFAYLSRMKHIQRWGLMHCTHKENVQEHSLQVAVIAHSLALIKNKYFDGKVNPERVALLGIYHDATEVITGDLPTPVKYFSPDLKQAYKTIEKHAAERMLELLPKDFRGDYAKLLHTDDNPEHMALVKSADAISAYIKCCEEIATGNAEFGRAKRAIEEKIRSMATPEVKYFMQNFVPSFSLTLDELSAPMEL